MFRSNAAYARAIRNAQRPYEKRLAGQIKPVLRQLARALINNPTMSVIGYRDTIASLITRQALKAGAGVASIEAAQVPVRKVTPVPYGWRQKFIDWARKHALNAAMFITSHTVQVVRDELVSGAENKDLSATDLAARIVNLVGSPSRAMLIARTEIATAANYSSEIVAQEMGVAYDKIWLSAADERTRPTHRAANGQKADPFGQFSIGGFIMAHPCDSSHGAPASEVVNCRCTTRRIYKI